MKISPHVEKLVFQKWEKDFGPAVYAKRKYILRRTNEVAFHEAGHVVARMFTGHEASHVLTVSIIPNAHTLGRETSERNISEGNFGNFPEPMRQGLGRNLLIGLLAGRAAARRVAKADDREDILDWLSDEWGTEGADLFRADHISTLMVRKCMPQHRILYLAEKWAVEMFEIPQVWATTEKLADALLQAGELAPSRIEALCSEIFRMSFKLPVWRNRLLGGTRSRKWLKEEEKKAWQLYESGGLG